MSLDQSEKRACRTKKLLESIEALEITSNIPYGACVSFIKNVPELYKYGCKVWIAPSALQSDNELYVVMRSLCKEDHKRKYCCSNPTGSFYMGDVFDWHNTLMERMLLYKRSGTPFIRNLDSSWKLIPKQKRKIAS